MAGPAPRKLVIVESPTKATKIASFLGHGYVVESSRGHVRDLPTGADEVPAKYKGEKWARTGVDVDNGFKPLYVVAPEKRSTIRELKKKLADTDELLLATDEDREGEAIAWHLLQELKPKVPVKRMVFHEITPQAIAEAVAHPRDLDLDLVDAQETRRILDRLYGYEVSPVLWKKVTKGLSAGRVQSVATRLVVDRERERIAFVSADYFDIEAELDAGEAAQPPVFAARLATVGGRKVATGRDFDAQGKLTSSGLLLLTQDTAGALAEALKVAAFAVGSVEQKPYTRKPYAPFRTTTLQQDAGRKLGFSAQRTMSVAQTLYEGGFITYMRTDSVTLSQTAIKAARDQAAQLYGADAVPPKPRVYTSKVKNAQEAHEAIRPAGEAFVLPADTGLHGDEARLYDLIWKRTIASQMADAEGNTVTVKIAARLADPVEVDDAPESVCGFTASGRTITKPGFLRAYDVNIDDDAEDASARLPKLTEGQRLDVREVTAAGHQTRPPARYTEPSLVAKLEELEIGRPSTYASILRTITSRDYVFKRGSALVPTWLAFAVTRLLEQHFSRLVDYKFTAEMEEVLDQIASGGADRVAVLTAFYFGDDDAAGLQALVGDLGEIDARGISSFPIGDSGIIARVGRYGPYVEDAEGNRGNVPQDLSPDELTADVAQDLLTRAKATGRELGEDPVTGNVLVLKDGRFGPYVTEELPENSPKTAKPRTASLFKSMHPEQVTLEDAVKLLSLPRVVGIAADGVQITAHNGPFSAYLSKGSDKRSLESEEQIFTVTLAEAETIYAAPKQYTRRTSSSSSKDLGVDESTGKSISVRQGRFGPYVTDGEYNATLKRTDSIEAMTLEQAAEMLAEKRAAGPPPAKKTTRRAAAPKTLTKRTVTRRKPK